MSTRALILTGFGINCDRETAIAFERAGAEAVTVHLNDLIEHPAMLDRYHIFAVPGGFSFGDDVGSGKILANRLRFQLGDALKKFIQDGKLVIGLCNGAQVLVKMGILPLFENTNGGSSFEFKQEVTLTHNDSNRYEDRWVHLKVAEDTPCVWLQDIDRLEVPVRHGEGKFIPRDDDTLARLISQGQACLRYVNPDGSPAAGEYPANPNGSVEDVAGICDPTGRVFCLMPHPEASICATQHPRWTREPVQEPTSGLRLFQNGVNYASTALT